MKFVDHIKLHVRSGNGGKGCSSFRREKFIPRGGPNGGDGGAGGAIILQGVLGKSTLLDFHYRQHFHAPNGANGMGKDKHGANGEDMLVRVPLGTVVKEAGSGEELLEIIDEEPRELLVGGKGGKGNARFKTSSDRAPIHFEEGRPGREMWVELELKLMADVGLVGFPNAGKSTLISAVSQARPKIADYPFTTLVPNLGVVRSDGFESFVMADIPGIIKGAHLGTGLGLQFLRHIQRTALLLLLLDASGQSEREPFDEYLILREEMEAFSATLLSKPRAVAITKKELVDGEILESLTKRLAGEGEEVFAISAVTGAGLPELLRYLSARVPAIREEARNAILHSDEEEDND